MPRSDAKETTTNRTFSYRAAIIGIVAMVALAIWVHLHEVVLPMFKVLAENSPPAGAVGIFIGVILIGALVTRLRPALGLASGELIVIYAMLVISAPLMSQGMWHRFLGFVVAIPHDPSNIALIDNFSEKLWPHGPHLVENRRFEQDVDERVSTDPASRVKRVEVAQSPVGKTGGMELVNEASDAAGPPEDMRTTLRLRVPRHNGGREQLVPGERYALYGLFRLTDMNSRSRLTLDVVSDGGSIVNVLALVRDTADAFSSPGGFTRKGEPYLNIPRDLDQSLDLVLTLEGPGRATVTDLIFFSNEAIARLHKGSSEVRAGDLARLPANDRDSLVVRPNNLASPKGIWYVLKGYIPYRQWLTPLFYWLTIVMAMFLCLLGISVIFRKQWAENERFSFPMVVIPRLLLEQQEEGGRLIRPLFRKRTFRAGVWFALIYCLLQGLAHYIPGMPDPEIKVTLEEYFVSPAVKAFFRGMAGSQFWAPWLFTSVAFFVDLEMLQSILICFWLAKLPYYFGEVFGWKSIQGPLDSFPFPHEQHIGAFLALAVIVLWISRKHLFAVGRRILGRPGGADDSGEAMSYRGAAFTIAGCFAFFGLWGVLTGMGAGSSLLFFGFLVICGLSAARIRTECGAPSTYFTPYFPYLIFFLMGGLDVFPAETMVLAYCAGGFMAVAQFLLFAPSQVEMFHLGNHFKANLRGVNWGLILGALGGILLGGYVMMVWAYGVGGENITYMKQWGIRQSWYLRSLRYAVADADVQSLARSTVDATASLEYQAGPVAAVGVGALVTILLTILRTRVVGFWLHPIGYVLANTYFVYGCWSSILLAWIIKALSLKIGGPRLIRDHMTPAFVGIFCGCVLGIALWDIVALVASANGMQDVFVCWP